MERKEVKVKQMMYEDFNEYSQIDIATATEWNNGEGIDIFIQRKNMSGIQIALAHDDISLLRKIFSDFDF